ncbi:hypothetical protein [Defluviicoccus vanus]|uniref:Spy/CpxP family protein refolding chaperone n=1 Tax=Defluviicoccus vanus TaxID=111831 RepID=A0A7H1N0Y0_9PROT|nr:hypothetical protein [Defluviicoccus vanus]QNT69366.1 hypothetical protein HQ394_08600 [Defluviicoccus vanus]
MRLKSIGLGLLLMVLVVLAVPALAASSSTDALTAKEVSAALATTKDLRPLHEKFGPQLAEYAKTVKPPEPGVQRDPCEITPEVQNAPGFNEMEQVVKKNGFKNGEVYCRVMERIIRAYTAVQVEEHMPELQQKLQEARAQIEADTTMPADQKEQLLARLTEHPAIAAARKVPDSDKKLVAQFRTEMDQLFLPPPGQAPAAPPPQQ